MRLFFYLISPPFCVNCWKFVKCYYLPTRGALSVFSLRSFKEKCFSLWIQINISEYPHTFTSKLKGQNVVEHDRWDFFNFEFSSFSTPGVSLRLVSRQMMQMSLGTGGDFYLWSHCISGPRFTEVDFLLWSSEMARRSTWRTGALRLLSMERQGNWFSRLAEFFWWRWWQCLARPHHHHHHHRPGHPPRGRGRDLVQDKQRFFLLSTQSGLWVQTIIMNNEKEIKGEKLSLSSQMQMVLWKQWSSSLTLLSASRCFTIICSTNDLFSHYLLHKNGGQMLFWTTRLSFLWRWRTQARQLTFTSTAKR